MVIADPADVEQRREQRAGVEAVQEAVAGVRVLLDVVRDARCAQRLLESLGAAAQAAVAGAVAGDDRAGPHEPLGGVLGDLAVVDRRGLEPAAWGAQQREAAAHAEADDPDPPGAVLARREKGPCRLDVVVGGSAPRARRAHRCRHTADAAPRVQVRRKREVARGREAVGLLADVVREPERVLDHDHARMRTLADGQREVAAELSGVRGEAQVGHCATCRSCGASPHACGRRLPVRPPPRRRLRRERVTASGG